MIVSAGTSSSVLVTVSTAVWFSATLGLADEVMIGASLASVTVTLIACTSVPPLPSLAVTCTS